METRIETADVFNIFCSYDELLNYFNEYCRLLHDLNCDANTKETTKFFKCLQLLEHIFLSESCEKLDKFKSVLIEIYDILSQQYLSKQFIFERGCMIQDNCILDTLPLLVKIIVREFQDNITVDHIFICIKDYFLKYSEFEDFVNEDGSKQKHLQLVLKFYIKVLQSLSESSVSNYISKEDFIQIFNLLPLSNKYAVNIFLNQVFPNLYALCDVTLKNLIIELLWSRTVNIFEKGFYLCKESYTFSLLCTFAEYLTKEYCKPEDFNILDDVPWKIIQNGLVSDNSFSRKQTIYVFKTFLFFIKMKNIVTNSVCDKAPLFHLHSIGDLEIWYDLVVLFEVLEEKQIHVIKPVLPKFSRILQLTSKYSSSATFVHPSWITCLIRRMIFHESKFIVKQGLSVAMNINFNKCQIHLLDSEKFIQVLVEGFNDQAMYSRLHENDSLSLFLSSEKFLDFFITYSAAFETNEQKADFFRYLLKVIASESWCGVAILHLTFALTNLNGLSSWKEEDIVYLREIQSSLKSHEPIVRTTVELWLIKCCILFMDWPCLCYQIYENVLYLDLFILDLLYMLSYGALNSLCLEKISELLSVFKSFERHTEIWNAVVLKLKEVFSSDESAHLSFHEMEKYCFSCIEKIRTGSDSIKKSDFKKIAKVLMILADSSLISSTLKEEGLNWYNLLRPLAHILTDAPKRPYMSQEMFFNALQLFTYLIEASQGSTKSGIDDHTFSIIKCLNCSVELFEFIYQKSFMVIKGSDDIIRFQILYNALNLFSSLDITNELCIKILPSFILKYNSVPDHYLTKKIVIILFYSISASNIKKIKCKELISNLFSILSSNLLKKILDEHVINDLSKSAFVAESERELWLRLTTKSVCDFWAVTSQVIGDLPSPDLQVVLQAIVEQAQSTFDGGSKSTYTSVINCIQTLVPKLGMENKSVINDLLNSAWKSCEELHGSEAYKPAITAFIAVIFQPFMLNENCFDILYKYLDCFQNISENLLGVFYFVMKQFCNTFSLKSLFQVHFNCIPTLVHGLTYGPIHHKSQKILEDTIAYISNQDERLAVELKNYSKPTVFVRVILVTYLMKHLYKFDSESEKFSLELLNHLLSLDESTRNSKSSKFANSFSHRLRNRIWQSLLFLYPNLITREANEKILKRILDLLEFDNQQPSVRYLQEWFVLKILSDHTCLIEYFLVVLENALEKCSGFLVSLLSILTHLILHEFISKNLAYKCFPILINCCMAQNFAVRLHSRLAIIKLFSFCEKRKITDLTDKYDFLDSILQYPQPGSALLEKGNVYKNLLKLEEDFYFAQFHPVRHFSLETIFYEFPRLSNLASEEWIKPEYFQDQLKLEDFVIPCFNADNCLKISISKPLSNKPEEESAIVDDRFEYNFQKKICPMRNESINCDINFFSEKKPKNEGLIVIASLVDKIPNLGGLCRTCEVFGVKEFVIGSLKYMEDKQFQNLAVSADRWVSIKEVKPYNLKEYLLSLKEEGYSVVGAEQTNNSCKLTDYVFKKKSALLLGQEKEGMPANLIQLLDACVEIPQQGVIRSLNVHVSGAIFIWEYAKQQIKPPS